MTARLVKRLAINFAIGAGLILLSLFVGMLAYRYFEDLRVEAHRTWAVEGAGVGPCTQPMPFADEAAKETRGPWPLGPLA